MFTISAIGAALACTLNCPDATVLTETPAVPELRTIPVAPVTLPSVSVFALAFVPMLIAPVVPLSKANTPVVVVAIAMPAVPVMLPTLVKLPVTFALPLKF